MSTKIFVNLPVKNLAHSISFFTHIGFRFDPQFTDDKATCMIIGEDIFVMLLTEEFFRTFIKKDIVDAMQSTEVILTLSADSRQEVNQIISKVVEAGGSTPGDVQDHGWMYGRGFQDPDGHQWEVMFMDMNSLPAEEY